MKEGLAAGIVNDLKAALSGLVTSVQAIASLRAHVGGVHGKERGFKCIDTRIAKLAICSASAVALWVIEKWQFRFPGAALTYRRPDLLDRPLHGLGELRMPEAASVSVLVVDNDAAETGRQTAERHAAGALKIIHSVERTAGIPAARNHALHHANAVNADVLVFIDDDEYPNSGWLQRLIGCWRASEAELIAGPVIVAPSEPGLSPWAKAINRSLQSRMVRKNHRTERAARDGGRYTIVTNNWLCDLAGSEEHGSPLTRDCRCRAAPIHSSTRGRSGVACGLGGAQRQSLMRLWQ